MAKNQKKQILNENVINNSSRFVNYDSFEIEKINKIGKAKPL